jgi:PAS domain S-box-containing protein
MTTPAHASEQARLTTELEAMAAASAEAEAYLGQLASALFPAGLPDRSRVTWSEVQGSETPRPDQLAGEQASNEARMREAEARFRTLVEQIPAVTFMAVLGEGKNEVYVSPHIEQMLGYTQKEWLENPFLWYWRLHEEDRKLWNEEFARGCRTGGPFHAECRFVARNGQVVWVHGEARLVRDELGRPLFLQGVAFDITENKRAEEVLLKEAVRTARQQEELAIARRVQLSLLPRDLKVPGLELAARMVPASEVGGDYYDVHARDDGAWLAVGDVSGHGLDAGLIMMMVQSATAGLLQARPLASPSELIAGLNEVLHDNIRRRLRHNDHVTYTLFRYFSDGRIVFAGAHEELIVRRARDGRFENIRTPGTWLGFTRDIRAVTVDSTLHLEPGDLLVLYTDGLTEAMDDSGRQFGLEGIFDVVDRHAGESCEKIADAILAAAERWASVQDDDRSLVVLRQRGI